MIKYKFDEIDITAQIDLEEALENSEAVGQLMVTLKDVLPETKNLKEGYLFQDVKNGLHFIVLTNTLVFVGKEGNDKEKSKEILATCFDSIGKLMIKEGQKYSELDITLRLIAIPDADLDTAKCFEKISKLIFQDSASEVLGHIGIKLKVGDEPIAYGIQPIVIEKEKTAFLCTFRYLLSEMEFSSYKHYLGLLDEVAKTKALDVLNNIIELHR